MLENGANFFSQAIINFESIDHPAEDHKLELRVTNVSGKIL